MLGKFFRRFKITEDLWMSHTRNVKRVLAGDGEEKEKTQEKKMNGSCKTGCWRRENYKKNVVEWLGLTKHQYFSRFCKFK